MYEYHLLVHLILSGSFGGNALNLTFIVKLHDFNKREVHESNLLASLPSQHSQILLIDNYLFEDQTISVYDRKICEPVVLALCIEFGRDAAEARSSDAVE